MRIHRTITASGRSGSNSVGFFVRASGHLYLDRRGFPTPGIPPATGPRASPPLTSRRATTSSPQAIGMPRKTTIAIDGADSNPDAKTLTFNENAVVPLTIQIGSGNSLLLSPSIRAKRPFRWLRRASSTRSPEAAAHPSS